MKINKIEIQIANALESIGYALDEMPSYRVDADNGRIVISVADNDDGEGDATLDALRKALPAGVSADWTGNSNTDGDGDTTSDIEIIWQAQSQAYTYAIDSGSGTIHADSLQDAYDALRANITDGMIADGATLWVADAAGNRITMGVDAE